MSTSLATNDECPHCHNGTVEVTNSEVCCRGECGAIWQQHGPSLFRLLRAKVRAVQAKYDLTDAMPVLYAVMRDAGFHITRPWSQLGDWYRLRLDHGHNVRTDAFGPRNQLEWTPTYQQWFRQAVEAVDVDTVGLRLREAAYWDEFDATGELPLGARQLIARE